MRVAPVERYGGGFLGDYAMVLKNLASDLKVPLTRILLEGGNEPGVVSHTQASVDFIDTYILGLQIASGQQQLQIEPVLLSPLFDEVAHGLHPLASEQQCQLVCNVTSQTHTVLADKSLLKALITALSYSSLQVAEGRARRVYIAAHKRRQKVEAGVFSKWAYTKQTFTKHKSITAKAGSTPSSGIYGVGSGVVVADVLAQLMGSPLKSITKHRQNGLVLSLYQSNQLALWS